MLKIYTDKKDLEFENTNIEYFFWHFGIPKTKSTDFLQNCRKECKIKYFELIDDVKGCDIIAPALSVSRLKKYNLLEKYFDLSKRYKRNFYFLRGGI